MILHFLLLLGLSAALALSLSLVLQTFFPEVPDMQLVRWTGATIIVIKANERAVMTGWIGTREVAPERSVEVAASEEKKQRRGTKKK